MSRAWPRRIVEVIKHFRNNETKHSCFDISVKADEPFSVALDIINSYS